MGSKCSHSAVGDVHFEEVKEDLEEYRLQVSHGSCTGCFWRPNPYNGLTASKDDRLNWPRNGAILRGRTHVVKDVPWFEAVQMKQLDSSFHNLGPNTWMGFDGGPRRGGQWLHVI